MFLLVIKKYRYLGLRKVPFLLSQLNKHSGKDTGEI